MYIYIYMAWRICLIALLCGFPVWPGGAVRLDRYLTCSAMRGLACEPCEQELSPGVRLKANDITNYVVGFASYADLFCLFPNSKYVCWADLVYAIGFAVQFGGRMHVARTIPLVLRFGFFLRFVRLC